MEMAKQDLNQKIHVLLNQQNNLKSSVMNTPLGPMIAIADDKALYVLEFVDQKGHDTVIQKIQKDLKSTVFPGENTPLQSIKNELAAYFEGTLNTFKTPLHLLGSPFQKQVWEALQTIPYGETRSYQDIAKALKKPTAYRAVANANGANKIAIVIPCHRVINTNGALGGYAGGLSRKQKLLELEKA